MKTQDGIGKTGELADELIAIADQEITAIRCALPSDPLIRFTMFLEVTRAVDYWAVVQSALPDEHRLKPYDFDIIQWGWNPACALLFSSLEQIGGIPVEESTPDRRAYALTLLHQLGRSVLLRRTSDMVRFGILTCERRREGYRFVQTQPRTTSQFLDTMEFIRLKELEAELWGDRIPSSTQEWIREDIEELMRPLIRPWDSGRGIMMGYDALPEVDNHFLAEATKLVANWRDEAGIHPNTSFVSLTGADVTAVAGLIISMHLKHVRFASIAARHHPKNINLPESNHLET